MFRKWGYRSLMLMLIALCCLHWVHGYWFNEGLGFNIGEQSYATESFRGSIYLTYYAAPPQAGGYWTYTTQATAKDQRPLAGAGFEFAGLCWAQGANQPNSPNLAIGIPYWFITLCALLAAMHVWRDTGREQKTTVHATDAAQTPNQPGNAALPKT